MTQLRRVPPNLTAIASLATVAVGGAVTILTAARIALNGRTDDRSKADVAVVFGAAVSQDGACPELLDRLDHTARLYTRGAAPVVVCCGGWSCDISESEEMRAQLIARGVPAEAIIVDDGGATSRQALAAVARLARGRWDSFCFVSSPYHMHRLMKEAERRSMFAVAAPVPLAPLRSLIGSRAGWHRIAGRIAPFVREILAVWWYAVPLRFSTVEVRKTGQAARASAQLAAAIEATGSDCPGGRSPSFDIPMAGPVISGFGWRSLRHHDGIDIRARYGSEVLAAAPGVVAYAGKLPIYGRVVAVRHGGGLSSVYGHLSSISVKQGASLRAREPIGHCGSSGNAFGPHLHFEVRELDMPVDPVSHLGLESRTEPEPLPGSIVQTWTLRTKWALQRLASVTALDRLEGWRFSSVGDERSDPTSV